MCRGVNITIWMDPLAKEYQTSSETITNTLGRRRARRCEPAAPPPVLAPHLALYDPEVNHRDLGGLVFHGRSWLCRWVGREGLVGGTWYEGIFFCLHVIFVVCKRTRVLENSAIVHSAPFCLNPAEPGRMEANNRWRLLYFFCCCWVFFLHARK